MQPQLRADVEHLAAIERPSASPGERRAAEWIADRFRAAGLDARIDEERAHPGYWWPIGLLNAIALAAAALPRRWLGRLIAAAAVAALVDDVDHRRRGFRRLLPRRPTYNVTAELGDPDAERTIVVVAHHDAAHGGAIFDTRGIEAAARRFPRLFDRVSRWPPVMWGVIIGPLLVALGRRRIGAVWSAGAIAAMADIGRTPVVPGANDNAAAVAALLQLATRRYDGVRVLLVSTGSEESNADGMKEWGRRHFGSLARATTSFVALETLGSGNLAIAEAEGFLVAHAYDGELKELAARCAADTGVPVWRGLTNSFMSDAIVPLHAGYPAMLLGALDDTKLPANYHKPWDTPDRVDYACVERAVELLDALIRAHGRPF
jgi:acetylornithine deacetylase/succinyl-diaminopimelate desuccinylase-like protein